MSQIIEVDHHNSDRRMVAARAHAAFELLEPERTPREPFPDTSIIALLDYIAEEMAREYVHLEKTAAYEQLAENASREEVDVLAAIYARYCSRSMSSRG